MTDLRTRIEDEREIDLARYQEDGFDSRVAYIESKAQDCDVTLEQFWSVADMYGPEEDFDGLVLFVEDHGPELAGMFA
jgi:uncharacterized protein (DUF2225 family)